MTQFDRYFLRQMLVAFCFFSLVLVGVFWIARSVSLFDRLIGGGQSASVFFEITALSLPSLIRTVMPMAVFGAAAHATNRLTRDSELTVMLSTGSTPWRLARPVLVFGLIMAMGMAVLTTYLRPASILQLDAREFELSRDVTARILNEGNFLHPGRGLTVYIAHIDDDGTLNGVFLSDRRDPANPVTYTGETAYLVQSGGNTSLVMLDGMALVMDPVQQTLSTTVFSDFTYDITELARERENEARKISAIPTLELILSRDQIMADEGHGEGQLVKELHERISWAFVCVAVALVGFSTLLLGSYSRFGLWPQVLLAFFLLLMIEVLRGSVAPLVVANPRLWALHYLPAVAGVLLAAQFLRMAGRPLRPKARRPAEVSDPV